MIRRLDRARTALLAIAVLLVVPSGRTRAQAPSPDAGRPLGGEATSAVDPSAVTPPKLMAFVDAGYPDAARASQREAAVLLQITIGDDGFVEEVAQVGPPAGDGFDELALAAARRFVFEPATKGGQPIRSRIQYRYEFKFQPPPEAPAPPPEARLTLSVRDADEDKPLADAEVLLSSPRNPSFALRLVTDASGTASATALDPGDYDFAVSHPKFTSERHRETLTVGETTALTYRLSPMRKRDEYGAVARVKAPPREVTRRTIEREELTRVAGTRGDALRTIELLPGVGRPAFGLGLVLIRGAGPNDSQIFLDGIPVPLLYHFGGLTSFINSRALDRIDFYPGNFSARFGRATGGVVDVGVRDAATDGYHGVIDTNLPLDSSILLEGPITKKASFQVGGRRSYLGEVLKPILRNTDVGSFAVPVYYDYQGFVSYRPTDRDRLRIGMYGASDRFDVLFAKNDDDPTIKSLKYGSQFHRAQASWRHQYSTRLEHDVTLSLGRSDTVTRVPPEFDLNLKLNDLYLRAEWRYRFSDAVQLIVGTDDQAGVFNVRYFGPPLPDDERSGGGASFGALPDLAYDRRTTGFAAAGYVEVALTPIKPLRIVPGMRLDYNHLIAKFSFDPRISAVYSVTARARLKAGVGVFSRQPDPPQAVKGFGNPNLGFTKALHYGMGVEYDLRDDLSLNLEGFYKRIYDRVVGTDYEAEAARGVLDPPPFQNDGLGRVYGLEVAGRKQAKGRWFGFLSYTLMRSERKDHQEPWRLFNYDQTHILSVAATVLLGRGWEMGGVLRVVSGNPITPIVGASYDQDVSAYTAENGALNSRRAPTFNRFDFRVEKKWTFTSWRLALYLDIQNAYNRRNVETTTYNFNYKESSAVRGLPIIPVLGLRGEM